MLMRQRLLHSSPGATSPHMHTHVYTVYSDLDIGMHICAGTPHVDTQPNSHPLTHTQTSTCMYHLTQTVHYFLTNDETTVFCGGP